MTTPDAGLNLDDLSSFTTTVQAGEFVFQAGDTAAELFIIQDGRVDLVIDDRTLETLDTGSCFGEGALLDGATRETGARAATDVRLIRLTRPALERVAAEAPQVAVALVSQLATRARGLHEALRSARVSPAAGQGATSDVKRGDPCLVEAETGTRYSLAGLEEATVGRPDRAAAFVPEVDLTAVDAKRTLSRRHARLVHRDGHFFVREEAGTRNGTFVNGTRITTGIEVELHDGDQVQFGFVKTVFEWR
jgi:CRP-like cAMP-binding protein